MSLASQYQHLLERSADMRREIFGACTVEFFADKLEGAPEFTCENGYHSSFRRAVKSESMGFLQPHDAVVRVPQAAGQSGSDFIPQVNRFIRVTLHNEARTVFRMSISEMPEHTVGAEWVLGCKAVL